jgi:hypothetical protein
LIVVALGLVLLGWIVWSFRSPSPESLFREYMGIPVPAGISGLRAYADYRTIDPAIFFRFTATPDAMRALSAFMGGPADAKPRTTTEDRQLYRGAMPNWWRPEEIGIPTTWTRDDGRVIRRVRADLSTGLTYVELLYY